MLPGTVADWLMLTVLMGGLSTASWLAYAWVLGAPDRDDEQSSDRIAERGPEAEMRPAA